jgi:hypothetical protein
MKSDIQLLTAWLKKMKEKVSEDEIRAAAYQLLHTTNETTFTDIYRCDHSKINAG